MKIIKSKINVDKDWATCIIQGDHEWRQKLDMNYSHVSLKHTGYYCIHCLMEIVKDD